MFTFVQANRLDYWRICASGGTIVFLVSLFLPWVSFAASYGGYGGSYDLTLVSTYSNLASAAGQGIPILRLIVLLFAVAPALAIGLIVLLALWPLAMILAVASVFNRLTALAAGILGIICWGGAVIFINGIQSNLASLPFEIGSYMNMQFGAGVFAGFGGAFMLLVARFFPSQGPRPQAAPPLRYVPVAARQGQFIQCPNCGHQNRVDSSFCGKCGKPLR
jgi:hypothetical protein